MNKTDSSGAATNVVEPVFSKIGDNNQFWAMILEKAWAKMKGNYNHADGGFLENAL